MISFHDWTIEGSGILARQFDNLSRRLDVTGDLPSGWDWAMLVQVGDAMDIIPLAPTEHGAGCMLTEDQLSLSGYYTMQLRGTQGDTVKHTNVIHVFVAESLSGSGKWPTVPSEFLDVERRIADLNTHPPVPGEDGFWLIWNSDTGTYTKSSLSLPGTATIPEKTEKYELIETIALAEDTYSIERTEEPDGTMYNFKSVVLSAKTTPGSAEANILTFAYLTDGTSDYRPIQGGISNSGQRYWQFEAEIDRGRFNVRSRTVISEREYQSTMSAPATDKFDVYGNINRLFWRSQSPNVYIPAGSTFEVWGVRA